MNLKHSNLHKPIIFQRFIFNPIVCLLKASKTNKIIFVSHSNSTVLFIQKFLKILINWLYYLDSGMGDGAIVAIVLFVLILCTISAVLVIQLRYLMRLFHNFKWPFILRINSRYTGFVLYWDIRVFFLKIPNSNFVMKAICGFFFSRGNVESMQKHNNFFVYSWLLNYIFKLKKIRENNWDWRRMATNARARSSSMFRQNGAPSFPNMAYNSGQSIHICVKIWFA